MSHVVWGFWSLQNSDVLFGRYFPRVVINPAYLGLIVEKFMSIIKFFHDFGCCKVIIIKHLNNTNLYSVDVDAYIHLNANKSHSHYHSYPNIRVFELLYEYDLYMNGFLTVVINTIILKNTPKNDLN